MNEKKIIDTIIIDLPTKEDINALREARSIDIRKNHTDQDFKDNYKFDIYTDLSSLTGKNNYPTATYLKDILLDNSNKIQFQFEGDYITNNESIELNKKTSFNRYSRRFVIRPVLRFDNNKELFDLLPFHKLDKYGNKLRYSIVNFGWYPRYATNYTFKDALPDLKETDEVFTFDSIYIHSENNYKKPFKPIAQPVYEEKGTKYINYRVNQCMYYERIDRLFHNTGESITLSNGKKHYNRNNVLIEVTPIPWIVDINRKVLIAKEGLLSGIQYDNFDKDPDTPIDYENSNIKWFLDTFMKKELLQDEQLIKRVVEKKQKDVNSKITSLLNGIKNYKKYYLGDIDINSKVKELLSDYNNELNKLSKNIDNNTNTLSIETKDPKVLYQKLVLNLEEILFELKTHGEKTKNYHDMIDILRECQKKEIDSNKDELCNLINTIKKTILKSITYQGTKDKLASKLNNILNESINRNKAYIEEFKYNDDVNIKSIDELKLEFRRDLHPFLKELSETVKKVNVVDGIWSAIYYKVNNEFTKSKNKLVGNYSNILNNIKLKINENGTNEDIAKLNNLLNNSHLNINDDINLIMKKIELIIVKAYKIQLDIEERQMRKKEINDLRISFDISNVFEEKSNTK